MINFISTIINIKPINISAERIPLIDKLGFIYYWSFPVFAKHDQVKGVVIFVHTKMWSAGSITDGGNFWLICGMNAQ